MGDLVNLNKARKKRRSTEKEKSAAENRAKFGRTKAEKSSEKSDRDRRDQALDGKRIDDGE